jgi:O-antigen/teichoic acid export membrane protein
MQSSINKISLDYKSLFKKFSHGLVLNILLKIKGVLYIPILVNFISKEDLGEISYIKAIVGLLTGIMLLNIPDSSNRIILKEDDKHNQNKIINSLTNFSFLSGLIFLLLFILISTIFNLIDLRLILIITSMLFSALIDKLSKYVFQIFQNTKLLSLVIIITEYVSFGVVCFVLFNSWYDDILTILYIYTVSLTVSSVYLFNKLFKSFTFKLIIDLITVKKVLKISLFLFPASYSLMIIQSSDYVIIERFIGLEDLGIYSFSYSLAGVVSGLSMAITFFWYSSAVYANKKQLEKLINLILRLSLIALILLIFGYYIFTDLIIELINPEYKSANNIIMILIVGFFIGVINQIYQGIMYADGNEKAILIDTSLIALTNLILNLIFIPSYGIKFAAFSTSLSFILLFILRTIYLYKNYSKSIKEIKYLYSLLITLISLITIIYYLWI